MDGKALVGGIAVGVGLTLLLDPSRGGRRRAIVRDRAVRYSSIALRVLDEAAGGVADAVRGMVSAGRARFQPDEVDDAWVLERVRARVGRACSHPRAVDVDVQDGEVSLRGPILAGEVSDVLTAAASVRGVHAVVNALEPHDSADGVPALEEAGGGLAAPAIELLQEHWAPATGAIVGLALAAGGVAVAACARR